LLKRTQDVTEKAWADTDVAVSKAQHIVIRAIQHVRKTGDFSVGPVHPVIYHDGYCFLRKTRAQYVDGFERRIASVMDAQDILSRPCKIRHPPERG
jgi:hypothetical protein